LTAEQVFASVSPSVAFIETEAGTGSAVLISGEKVVTNMHVVWPFSSARVVFPNGTEIADAPVIHSDNLADLAILDLTTDAPLPQPARFGDPASLNIGSTLYLIGYPLENDANPQPSIARGLLSRQRTWSEAGLDYLQTDANIAGGQSGGALVSEAGEVVGISSLGVEGFALALSATTVADRVAGMLAGDDVDGVGDREFPPIEAGTTEVEDLIPNFYAEVTYLFKAEEGTDIDIKVHSGEDVAASLVAPDAVLEAQADEIDGGGVERIELRLELSGTYVLAVGSFALSEAAVVIESNMELVPLIDHDHGRALQVGEPLIANGDYPGDIDWFTLDLVEGDKVAIRVTSANIDPSLTIDLADNSGDPLGSDDDSGGGLLGTDAELTFTAPATDSYVVSVFDSTSFGPGAYIVSVERA
jgi:hypothetical protein